MDKKEFLKEKYIKEKALELFPECYSKDLKVSTSFQNSLRILQRYITDYFEKGIFDPTSSEYNDSKISDIRDAYCLVKKEYSREDSISFEYASPFELFKAYNSLISNIGDYHFIARWENSYGSNQNRSNKQILLEISMLYPVLIDILEKIDKYYDDKGETLFADELEDKISYWITMFKIANSDLDEAKADYYKVFAFYNRSCYPVEDFVPELSLGQYKKNWKLRRNDACNTIYKFYQDIIKINKAVDCESFDVDETSYSLEVSEIEQLYNYAMENIATGPNYYCYLDDLEREEDRNANVLKKAIRKM